MGRVLRGGGRAGRLAALLVAGVALAGCGDSSDTPGEPGVGDAADDTQQSDSSASETPGGPGVDIDGVVALITSAPAKVDHDDCPVSADPDTIASAGYGPGQSVSPSRFDTTPAADSHLGKAWLVCRWDLSGGASISFNYFAGLGVSPEWIRDQLSDPAPGRWTEVDDGEFLTTAEANGQCSVIWATSTLALRLSARPSDSLDPNCEAISTQMSTDIAGHLAVSG